MRIFLLRHGETEWSRIGRRQGRGDSPLTPLGMAQAAACGLRLRQEIDPQAAVMVTSTLGRARHTGAIIREQLGMPAEACGESDLLSEHDFGDWQGLTTSEIEARFPGELQRRRKDHWSYVVSGGESYAQMHARVSQWFDQDRPASDTIVVAHEMVSRVFRGIFLNLSHEQTLKLNHPHLRIFALENAKVREIDVSLPSN